MIFSGIITFPTNTNRSHAIRVLEHIAKKTPKHAQHSVFQTCKTGSVYLLTVVMLAPPFPALSQHVTKSKEQKPPLLHSAQPSPVAMKPLNSLGWSRTCRCIRFIHWHTCHRSRNRRPVCWHTGAVPRRCTPTLRSSLKKKRRKGNERVEGWY